MFFLITATLSVANDCAMAAFFVIRKVFPIQNGFFVKLEENTEADNNNYTKV